MSKRWDGYVLLVEGVEKRLTSGDDITCCRHERRLVILGMFLGSFTRVVVTLCHSYVEQGSTDC
jgi:hypothetical protein